MSALSELTGRTHLARPILGGLLVLMAVFVIPFDRAYGIVEITIFDVYRIAEGFADFADADGAGWLGVFWLVPAVAVWAIAVNALAFNRTRTTGNPTLNLNRVLRGDQALSGVLLAAEVGFVVAMIVLDAYEGVGWVFSRPPLWIWAIGALLIGLVPSESEPRADAERVSEPVADLSASDPNGADEAESVALAAGAVGMDRGRVRSAAEGSFQAMSAPRQGTGWLLGVAPSVILLLVGVFVDRAVLWGLVLGIPAALAASRQFAVAVDRMVGDPAEASVSRRVEAPAIGLLILVWLSALGVLWVEAFLTSVLVASALLQLQVDMDRLAARVPSHMTLQMGEQRRDIALGQVVRYAALAVAVSALVALIAVLAV